MSFGERAGGVETVTMSVVIPAHNEAAVITRLLRSFSEDPRSAQLQIVVVPNGCTDDTAAQAAAFSPPVAVSTLAEASKIAALRECDRVATEFPRAYVDADVTVSVQTLLALADALAQPGAPMVASPFLVVDTEGASWPVRSFFRIWALTEYRQTGLVGAGIYALSAEGRGRFTDWPQVIADDRFIQQLFLPAERLVLRDHSFSVRSPRNLRSHLRREIRIARGNLQLPATVQRAAQPRARRHFALLWRVARRPLVWPDFVTYFLITLAVRMLTRRQVARGSSTGWNRDESTRTFDVI